MDIVKPKEKAPYESPELASTRAPSPMLSPLHGFSESSDSDGEFFGETSLLQKEADHGGLAVWEDGLFEFRVPLLAIEAMPISARSPCLVREDEDDEKDRKVQDFDFRTGKKVVPSMLQMEEMLNAPDEPLSPIKSASRKRRLVVMGQASSTKHDAVVDISSNEPPSCRTEKENNPRYLDGQNTSTTIAAKGTMPATDSTPQKRRRVILTGGSIR